MTTLLNAFKFSFVSALALALTAPGQLLAAELEVFGRAVNESGGSAGMITVLVEVTDMRIRRQVGYEQTRSELNGSFYFDLSKYEEIPQLGLQFNTLSALHREAVKIIVAKHEDFPIELNFELEPGAVVAGRVKDEKGQPITDAEVLAMGVRSVRTGPDGSFELVGLRLGSAPQITVRKSDYAEVTLRVDEFDENARAEGVEFVLTAATTIEGQLLNPQGIGIDGAMVTLEFNSMRRVATTTKAGNFAFEKLPVSLDEVTLVASSEGMAPYRQFFPKLGSENSPLSVILQWPYRIGGKVSTADGKPAGAFEILVQPNNEIPGAPITPNADASWISPPLPVGTDCTIFILPKTAGKTRTGDLEILSEVTPGQWKGEVTPWPDGVESSFTINRKGDGITMVRLDSGLGGEVGPIVYTGKINPAGNEISGDVFVESSGAKGTFRMRQMGKSTALLGIWDFWEKLEAGTLRIAPARKKIEAPTFAGTQRIDIQLGEGHWLGGRVVNNSGVPQADVIVSISQWDDDRYFTPSTTTNSQGRFRLQGLPEGLLHLTLQAGPEEWPTEPIILWPTNSEIELNIENPGADPIPVQ